jgi:FMN-dependent oxidoreductase (nitrilotriacetate monooxygenase family)
MRSGQMHLNVFLMDAGHHEAAWRLPEANPYLGADVEALQQVARTAERGKLDSLFIADIPALWMGFAQRPQAALDPLLLLTMMAGVTSQVGLIATLSTTYNEPYNVARRLATLDHLSGGRAGWNIVTTAGREVARNFNLDDQPEHAKRYVRADEFVEVCLKLWDSWEDDAVLADKELGVWGDERKLHPAQHRGDHYSVQGALNVPRMPQGYPLLVQAGSSDDGKAFAARWAEAVFTSQPTIAETQRFYTDVKALAQRSISILPGLVPVIGDTEAEAQAKQEQLDSLVNPLYTRKHLSRLLRVEPERLELDKELPDDLPEESQIEGGKSRFSLVVGLARREKLTVRQLIARFGRSRGHNTVIGTPEQVADAMCAWFEAHAADGFNLMPPYAQALDQFVDQVVPLLQRRGVFRRHYTGRTLRDHYGVPRPANRYAR